MGLAAGIAAQECIRGRVLLMVEDGWGRQRQHMGAGKVLADTYFEEDIEDWMDNHVVVAVCVVGMDQEEHTVVDFAHIGQLVVGVAHIDRMMGLAAAGNHGMLVVDSQNQTGNLDTQDQSLEELQKVVEMETACTVSMLPAVLYYTI